MFSLTELQHDALVEIFNLGVGQAAASMSRIVNEEVTMSFPSIAFQSRAEAVRAFGGLHARRICAVSQHYQGAFNTEAILMFHEENSLEIVRLMIGGTSWGSALTEMEQEAMSEIGNIVLNCCIGRLANMTGQELHGDLPQYRVGSSAEIFGASANQWNGLVLTLKIDFSLERHQIAGYLAVLLDVAALTELQGYLDLYLSGLSA